jgi:hypothetical protein
MDAGDDDYQRIPLQKESGVSEGFSGGRLNFSNILTRGNFGRWRNRIVGAVDRLLGIGCWRVTLFRFRAW